MANGRSTKHRLYLPSDDPKSMRAALDQFANNLPLGAVGFDVVRVSNDGGIPNGNLGYITWEAALVDKEGWFNNASPSSVLTVPRELGGVYNLKLDVYVGGAAANWVPAIHVNSVCVAGGLWAVARDRETISVEVPLNAGDRVQAGVHNVTGGILTVTYAAVNPSNPGMPRFRGYRISLL